MAAEKNFETKVKRYLKEQGAWFLKYWGGGYAKSGIPDILACINGIFFGIELKSSVGTSSELQKYNVREINSAGGVAMILYPEGFDDFKSIVEGVKACNTHIQELAPLKNAHSNSKCDTLTG